MKRLSPPAWAILQHLLRRPMPPTEWRTLDQRYLRGLYLSGLFYFDRQSTAHITTDGKRMVLTHTRLRKDPSRPVFTERLPRLVALTLSRRRAS